MAGKGSRRSDRQVVYPSNGGDFRLHLLIALLDRLEEWYRDEPDVYVSGDVPLYYDGSHKRRKLMPEVFVVKGVPKGDRNGFRVWEEKPPALVIELRWNARFTRKDVQRFEIYRDVLRVKEVFSYDLNDSYFRTSLKGYRLAGRTYRPLPMIHGRILSKVLGLHLEPYDRDLQLHDPVTDSYVLSPFELLQWAEQNEATRRAETDRERIETENQRLRRENEELRRRLGEGHA